MQVERDPTRPNLGGGPLTNPTDPDLEQTCKETLMNCGYIGLSNQMYREDLSGVYSWVYYIRFDNVRLSRPAPWQETEAESRAPPHVYKPTGVQNPIRYKVYTEWDPGTWLTCKTDPTVN
ncbi:hypothetical protein CBL_09048 [Carabus blaptoides fortunei]